MGLKFPESLEDWRAWEQKQNFLRYAKTQVKGLLHRGQTEVSNSEPFVWAQRPDAPPAQVLVALEITTPTQLAALYAPAKHLEDLGYSIGVLAPASTRNYLMDLGLVPLLDFEPTSSLLQELSEVQQVIAVGHYLQVGAWSYARAQEAGWDFNVVQHGLNTPFVPPLPAKSYLFSFSEKDSVFWVSGRTDIQASAVGSQLFYEALQKPPVDLQEVEEQPIFLGQMHGAELPRLSFARSSYDFCQKTGAVYRPHPSERDKLSTLTHKLWAKQGISIDSGQTPLNQLNAPVVSIFSTGVLEAAIRGIPAWVYHSNPPAWLKEFWERYGMNQWGSEPTPPPVQPTTEPALAIAQKIAHRLEN